MKRLIMILLLFTVSFAVYSQDSTKYVTDTNTEKLIDKYSDKIGDAITALAEKLQQPAEHVYKVLVKQQVVWGVGTLVGVVLGALFLFIGLLGISKWRWDDDYCIPLNIVGVIILLVSLVLFFFYGLTGLINPEYGALKDIVNMIK